ncbi:MAG: thermonuclease family protein [Pacificimonas sp.]
MPMRSFLFSNVLPLSLIAFVLGLLFLPGAEAVPARGAAVNGFSCDVTSVHDGDGPIYCRGGTKIRLTAIAARELDDSCRPHHPCPAASGAQARQALTALAAGQLLSCEATGESYGRVTAWCWRPDGVELNCAMVRRGAALHWARYDPAGRLCSG